MPRGAKVDREATRVARMVDFKLPCGENYEHYPRLTDHRSFVTTTGHLRLYGRDMGVLRARVYEEQPNCTQCGERTIFEAHPCNPLRAELHHIVFRGRGGCDCRHNVEIRHGKCHRGPGGAHG